MSARFRPNEIQTFTGKAYNFEAPTADMVVLDDIAHALSNACRFAGHVRRFYSVAEHCVRVSITLETWFGARSSLPLYGLLHDAQESYVWDCPRPFKPLLGDAFKEFADKADAAIAAALLPYWVGPEVFHLGAIKRADDALLVAEARLLMRHGPDCWSAWENHYREVPPVPPEAWYAPAVGWSPATAEAAFLDRAKELGLIV